MSEKYMSTANCKNCLPDDSNECLIHAMLLTTRGELAKQLLLCSDGNMDSILESEEMRSANEYKRRENIKRMREYKKRQ